jgi:starch synthase
MKLPRIMMVSSEAAPWAKSGGLADVVGALPRALASLGHAVSVVIPRYMRVIEAPAWRIIDRLPIPLGGAEYPVDIWTMESEGVTLYFIDHPMLSGRSGLYSDQNGDYTDNHVRFALLSKGALEVARRLFPTDIFHCHDWQAGLLPVYLKESTAIDPHFLGAKVVLTIHNLGYQGVFDRGAMRDISLPDRLYRLDLIEFWGKISLLKAGVVFSDALTTVSPTYAREIQTPEHGFGMDGLLRARRGVLTGILNGVDYEIWNPATDPVLPAHFSVEDLTGKRICKQELLREMGLPEAALDRPLMGIVSRFAGQKGFDLIEQAAWDIFRDDVYLVVLGSGEARYEEMFAKLRSDFPRQVALGVGYNDPLAHRIEAGSDIFLMPSRYEPCGLNQIYSLRYGTVPVVRATGGLDDTIDESTGFKFFNYNGMALLEAIRTACAQWEDREKWTAMMARGMKKDFSWTASAVEYSRLYHGLHPLAV